MAEREGDGKGDLRKHLLLSDLRRNSLQQCQIAVCLFLQRVALCDVRLR